MTATVVTTSAALTKKNSRFYLFVVILPGIQIHGRVAASNLFEDFFLFVATCIITIVAVFATYAEILVR